MVRPRVSVIIPNYNHAPYLTWRIDTVLNQTFRDIEVIILDDCSTDNSREVIEQYRDRAGVAIHYNESNSGSVFRQWERGMSLASGEYLWVAESDDWADPKFLERMVPVLDANPKVGVAYCQSWIVDKAFQVTGNAICWTEDLDPELWKRDFVADGQDALRRFLVVKNFIPNSSAVLQRKSVVDEVRPIETDFRLCGDWMHWSRMLAVADLAFVAENLNFWRFHSSNARTLPPGVLEWQEGERILKFACGQLNMPEAERDRILFCFIRKCWQWLADYARSHNSA